MRDAPFNSVAASMVVSFLPWNATFTKRFKSQAEGTASPCFVSNLLNDIDTDAVSQREIIKGCAGLAYAGGCPHAV